MRPESGDKVRRQSIRYLRPSDVKQSATEVRNSSILSNFKSALKSHLFT